MFKKLFLPVGMLLSVIWALIDPAPGVWFKSAVGTPAMIIAIFLVSGMQANFKELKIDRRSISGLAMGAFFALVMLSMIGWAMLFKLPIDKMLLAGLLVTLAAPPTLSSGIVMTIQAAGNMMLSVAITVIFNVIAIITLPIVLGILLNETVEGGVNSLAMFKSLIITVLIPLIIGNLFRKFVMKSFWHKSIDYIPLIATIALIWTFFAAARDKIVAIPLTMDLAVLALGAFFHILSMVGLWAIARMVKMDSAERKAMVFCGASKSATMALAMVGIAGLGATPAAVPCLLFYALQMLMDSILSNMVKERDI